MLVSICRCGEMVCVSFSFERGERLGGGIYGRDMEERKAESPARWDNHLHLRPYATGGNAKPAAPDRESLG